ncbi:hypothetical protein K431DRAFT_282485 [Polychaeton citri CBS 116435]|uniref:BZIP domain-containing protein n=1 Tax=Polychaeton citri CBS 116435 TaxID=1314669 RepID=A0A9P4QF79_9PEZI|nr:hypothetical protein K431DRAFT_282485 [Polychaeton citri CBS 116435]
MPNGPSESQGPAAAAKAQNLARIRDNQRRSRARRKEYLQELEEKYRQCEQVGIGASAELQAAARRVLDENTRLRELLKKHGLSDAQIDQTRYPENPQYPSAATSLETMLSIRRPCGSCCGSGSGSSEAGSRKQSSPSAALTRQQDPVASPETEALPSQLQVPAMYHEGELSGSSNLLHAIAPSNFPILPDNTLAQYNGQPGQAPQPQEQQYVDQNVQYGNEYFWDAPYSNQNFPELTNHNLSGADSSSCHAAASAIRTMEPDAGLEVEQELGCRPGEDCNVPNAEIFKIMDRYHGGPGL